MRMQFLYDLVVIHAYFSELGVESGQPRGEFHRPPVGSDDPKLIAEDPCFDKSGLRERARLLEQREEPGIFLVREAHHHAIFRRVRFGRPAAPAPDGGFGFFHAFRFLPKAARPPVR